MKKNPFVGVFVLAFIICPVWNACQGLVSRPRSSSDKPTEKIQISSAVRAAYDSIANLVLNVPGILVHRIEGIVHIDAIRKSLPCGVIILSGSRKTLSGKPGPGDVIRAFLSEKGWSEELACSADGPDGTSFAFSKNGIWCIVGGQWDGPDDSDNSYGPGDAYQFVVYCAEIDVKP